MNAYPGPFKCPDCGEWWAGFTHRCRVVRRQGDAITVTVPSPDTHTFTVGCTCHRKGETTAQVTCPIHDVAVTYTA